MKIKNWLGHKSLEVTQIYLDSEMHDPEEQAKLDRAGKSNPKMAHPDAEFPPSRQVVHG